jgi:hypothetical protein
MSLGNTGAPIWFVTGVVAVGLVAGLLTLHGVPRLLSRQARRLGR